MDAEKKKRMTLITGFLSLIGLVTSFFQAHEKGFTTATILGIVFTVIAILCTIISVIVNKNRS